MTVFLIGTLITEASIQFIALLRFLLACSVIGIFAWSFFRAIASGFAIAKTMHQIPCTKCQFFTNDYRLKCTAQPHIANTEEAIHCTDYQARETLP